MCWANLDLKEFFVSPMYAAVEDRVETVHLYTTLDIRHFPFSGHDTWFLQLHSDVLLFEVVLLSFSELEEAID